MAGFHWPWFDSSRPLSAADAAELASRVAELTKAGLPLGEGLRALASELSGQRLPNILRAVAARLDAGDDLATAFELQGCCLPAHLAGLVLAGLRSGRLAQVLEEYVDLQRSRLELRHRIWQTVAYPVVLIVFAAMLLIFAGTVIVPSFEKIFMDFNTRLPPMTIIVLKFTRPAAWLTVVVAMMIIATPLVVWLASRLGWVWSVLHRVPMIGPLLRWSQMAQFSRLMALSLDQQMPLPDALRLTAAGLGDVVLARACRRAAADVETGRDLHETLAERPFPASLIPLVQWGQRGNVLGEAFEAAAEMFEGRVRSHGTMMEAVLLPGTMIGLGFCVGFLVIALFLPLISLVACLSG